MVVRPHARILPDVPAPRPAAAKPDVHARLEAIRCRFQYRRPGQRVVTEIGEAQLTQRPRVAAVLLLESRLGIVDPVEQVLPTPHGVTQCCSTHTLPPVHVPASSPQGVGLPVQTPLSTLHE